MAADRTALLAEVAAALSTARSVEGVIRALVGTLVPSICDGCEVALPDGTGAVHRIVLARTGGSWAAREDIPVPDLAIHPVHVVMRTGEVQLLELANPGHAPLFGPEDDPSSARALGVHTALVVPLSGRERIVGALSTALVDPDRTWDADDRTFLAAVGRLTALAIENIEALAHERDARTRLSALAAAGVIGIISGEGDVIDEGNDAFRRMLGLGSVAGVRWPDLTPPEWAEQDRDAVAQMLLMGHADPFEKEFLHADGRRVPVIVGGARLSAEPFRWIVFVADITERRAAEAQVRHIADTLQASLLPSALPDVPGFDVCARYWPAGVGLDVGGDFYDVFPLRDPGRFGIAIGDVCGKGVEAASMTAVCRHTTRAAALHIADPAAVLRWVHDTIAGNPDERFVTLAYAVLDAPEGRLSLALGGHPHPMHVTAADRSVRTIGRAGTVLGLVEPDVDTVEVDLAPGDLVVLYTDGVTDAPADDALTDEELAAVLASAAGEPLDAVADRVRGALLERRPSGPRDDVALLLLRRR